MLVLFASAFSEFRHRFIVWCDYDVSCCRQSCNFYLTVNASNSSKKLQRSMEEAGIDVTKGKTSKAVSSDTQFGTL